jgi:hypothetical protein
VKAGRNSQDSLEAAIKQAIQNPNEQARLAAQWVKEIN